MRNSSMIIFERWTCAVIVKNTTEVVFFTNAQISLDARERPKNNMLYNFSL